MLREVSFCAVAARELSISSAKAYAATKTETVRALSQPEIYVNQFCKGVHCNSKRVVK